LYRILYRRFDLIVCQSEYMLNDLNSTFNISRQKCTVIQNPVDVQKIQQMSFEKIDNWPFNQNRTHLLAIGRLEYQKGYDILIEAFAKLDEHFDLTIIGEGSLRSNLEEQAKSSGVNSRIIFLGFQSNPYKFMQWADYFVLSSRFEGLPNVLLESFACGTPVVAFDSPGGTSEILRNGFNGLLVTELTASALADSIERVQSISFSKREISNWVSDSFGVERIAQKYIDILQND